MKTKAGSVGVEMCVDEFKLKLITILTADVNYTEWTDFQKRVNGFNTVPKRGEAEWEHNMKVIENSEVTSLVCP